MSKSEMDRLHVSFVERWSDEPPDETQMWTQYQSGISTILTHGGPLAPFVECRDELSLENGVFTSKRSLVIKQPIKYITMQMKLDTK